MDQLFYDLLVAAGFAHPLHPVLITLVVGPVIAAFLLVAVAVLFNKPEFFKTSRHLTVVAFIFWFPTVAVGLIDWAHFYGASTKMAEINVKLVLAGVLFFVLLGNILLFKAGEKKPWIPLLFLLVATVLVSSLGYFGGEIVFGSKSKTATSASSSATTPTVNSQGFKELQQEGYTLAWRVHERLIDVRVTYATNGWVGVGFGKTGTMEGSHIVLGFTLDGKATVADHFGYARNEHGPQDLVGGKDTLTSRDAQFVEGKTTVSFTMPLNTGNPKDPVLVEGEAYKVILANGGQDASDLESYHGRTGRIVVDLIL